MSAPRLGAGILLGHYIAGSPRWEAARAGRLGASEIAAVLGFSPWLSPFALWHMKAGTLPAQHDNEEMSWGRDLEALIARRFDRNHAPQGWWLTRCGLYANRHRPYQVAQPDRVLHMGNRRLAALEIKTDRTADEWGRPGSDEIPLYYRAQVMWQMDTMGWEECWVAVLISGSEYREYRVTYSFTDAALMRLEAELFLDSLRTGDPPPLDGHEATYRAVRALHPEIDEVDVEVDEHIATDYLAAVADFTAAEERKRHASAQLALAMGRARRAVCAGTRIAIRVPTPGGTPHLRPNRTTAKAAAA